MSTDQVSGGVVGRQHRRRRSQGPGAAPYLLILPALVFFVAFVLVPIFNTARLSLFEWDGLLPQQWVGLDNFRDVLTDPNVITSFKVSAVMVVTTCALPVLIALVLVGIIARTRIRGLSIFRFVYFLPYTVALAVVAIAWRWLYAKEGTINKMVGAVLGDDVTRAWLGDFDWALPALSIVGLWATFGFALVMLMSGAQHIPTDLYDAARVDGAGPIREFFAVTLPGIRHELRVVLVMTLIMALRVFDLPLVTTQGGPGYNTTTPSLLMYKDVFVNSAIGRGAAIAVLLTLVTLIGVWLVNRLIPSED